MPLFNAYVMVDWSGGDGRRGGKQDCIAPRRITDVRAGSDTPFRLFGTGSVGSQVLTGIPRLENFRSDPQLEACSAV